MNLLSRTLGTPHATRFFFNAVAPIYRWLTDNPTWRASLHELARHFPPSTSTLRLLDVGCGHGNSALAMLALRGDLHITGVDFSAVMLRMARRESARQGHTARTAWTQADVTRLPMPDNSVDAITGHSLYYMLADRPAFLREALRVLRPGGRLILLDPIQRPLPFRRLLRRPGRVSLALFMWHLVSRAHDRFTLPEMVTILESAGFERVLTEKAVEGFGVLSRGEKPYTHLSTVERIAGTAAREGEGEAALLPITAARLGEVGRGRYVFLLVRQSAEKPPWAMTPEDEVRWEAATAARDGQAYLLAFSSLPKAVEFMQPAIKAGALVGVNKIAKFDKAAAQAWPADVLLNLPFEALGAVYQVGEPLPVDPSQAITGEE